MYFDLAIEAYSEPRRKFKIEGFAKLINGFYPLLICPKGSILDVWQGSEYVSEQRKWNKIETRMNMVLLTLNLPEKLELKLGPKIDLRYWVHRD